MPTLLTTIGMFAGSAFVGFNVMEFGHSLEQKRRTQAWRRRLRVGEMHGPGRRLMPTQSCACPTSLAVVIRVEQLISCSTALIAL